MSSSVARIKEMTRGTGADSVLECVGTRESMAQAIHAARPGGYVSYVGVPHGVELNGAELFFAHVHLHGGPGMTKDVAFDPVDGPINDRIDEAYRKKYRGSPYLGPMIGAQARSATVRVTPREAER